jgi:hypothetical protein
VSEKERKREKERKKEKERKCNCCVESTKFENGGKKKCWEQVGQGRQIKAQLSRNERI